MLVTTAGQGRAGQHLASVSANKLIFDFGCVVTEKWMRSGVFAALVLEQ